MATVSTRVDDKTKMDAEEIANEIGIPLSTAINIFLKKFVSDHGFPFKVVSKSNKQDSSFVDIETLNQIIKKAISDTNNLGIAPEFTYLDPKTKELITHTRKE